MAITVNLRYKGKNGAAKRFAEEMVSTGTVDVSQDFRKPRLNSCFQMTEIY